MVEEWKACNKTFTDKIPDSIRTYLLIKANNKCSKCGFEGYNPVSHKTILQIHHIDGNADNCKEDNLQVLCPNCHAMTDTYMSLNKGKSARTERYRKRVKVIQE